MKSSFSEISGIFLITIIVFIIVYLAIGSDVNEINAIVQGENKTDQITNMSYSHPQHSILLINTTDVSNCLSPKPVEYIFKIHQKKKNLSDASTFESDVDSTSNLDNTKNQFCEFDNISDSDTCEKFFTNQTIISCDSEINNDSNDNANLSSTNFDSQGLLLADTKFGNQYSFESKDPLYPANKMKISMDFDKHTQGGLKNLNSPRIEVVRENMDDEPNMSTAKNQIIKWQGSIKQYFKAPKGDFENETYIDIQFNTGRHTSDNDDERKGFGVLFDISGDSNPNLFEFRDNGRYVKYDYETIKKLAGDSFIFYHKDNNGNPVFINNLTNTDNVTLKVETHLSGNDSRIVKTFIGNGLGKEIPYWTINNLTKLKEHDEINNEGNFIDTINQGSGYVIARTDNIDTRLLTITSLVLPK